MAVINKNGSLFVGFPQKKIMVILIASIFCLQKSLNNISIFGMINLYATKSPGVPEIYTLGVSFEFISDFTLYDPNFN